jgi:hypothetical protein
MKKIVVLIVALLLLPLPVFSANAAGTATVSVELTAIGCGYLVAPVQVETDGSLRASEAVLRVLADHGYTAFYGGSPESAFYLAYVADGTKSGSFNGYRTAAAEYPVEKPRSLGIKTRIPEKVSAYLEKNADYFDPADYETSFSGYIGEFVYTNGSGWMYSLNGSFRQQDLSSVRLAPGDTLRLIYSLWYGADVGGAEPSLQAAFNAALAEAETEPTTVEPTTVEPTTAEPTTAEPTTAEPTTAAPITTEPTTAEPTTEESTGTEAETTPEETSAPETSETASAEGESVAPPAQTKRTHLYWIIPAAAAVPVTALAVVIVLKKHKENAK